MILIINFLIDFKWHLNLYLYKISITRKYFKKIKWYRESKNIYRDDLEVCIIVEEIKLYIIRHIKRIKYNNIFNYYYSGVFQYEKYLGSYLFLRTNRAYLKSNFLKIKCYCKNIVYLCLLLNLIFINEVFNIYYNISINYQYFSILFLFYLFTSSIYMYWNYI